MDLNLAGKVAIVTGGARGIGREIALTFATEGASVIVDDIDLAAADAVAQEARALGTQAFAVRADVTNSSEVNQMVEEALRRFKRVDVLINNAGVQYTQGRPTVRKLFAESNEEEWRGEIGITLYGVLNCTKAVIDTMIKQKGGAIVNVVSDAGRGPWIKHTIYGAGKGAIISFTRSLAQEVGQYGIRVNCVSPGHVRATRMIRCEAEAKQGDPEAIKYLQRSEAIIKQMPLGRIGTPSDIANVAVFLASDRCSFVTGQALSVNGGLVMP